MTTARPSTSTRVSRRIELLAVGLLASAAIAIASIALGASGPSQSAGGAVSGVIEMAPGAHKTKLSDTAALYIIARPGGQTAGMPLAVRRVPQPFKFPMDFTLSQANVMMPDVSFTGKVAITARISQSGAATPVNAGDLETSKPAEVEVGSGAKARLLIDKAR